MTTDADATAARTVAILVADGFEESQLTGAQRTLLERGLEPVVVGQDGILVHGWHDGAWGHHFMSDARLGDVLSADHSALLLPDGAQSVATLARDPHAKRLIRAFVDSGKPVAVLGHAVALLEVAEAVAGRRVTGAAAVREDVTGRGGAVWADEPAVTDGNLMTAVGTAELPQVLAGLAAQVAGAGAEVGHAA